jgi:hypothetical protein
MAHNREDSMPITLDRYKNKWLPFAAGRSQRNSSTLRRVHCAVLGLLAMTTLVWNLSAVAVTPTESAVLQNIYTAAGGPGWTNSSNWLCPAGSTTCIPGEFAIGSECTWFGITCDANGDVTAVVLNANNLVGTIPDLSGLTHLVDFHANNNQLSGQIPQNINELKNLVVFEAIFNQLTGSIPPLAGLTNLELLKLYNNHLTGPIPVLTGLSNLQQFLVSFNALTGDVPDLSTVSSLIVFEADNNELDGEIKTALTGLPHLSIFTINDNRLTGTIPLINGLSNLSQFNLAQNQLTGTIPSISGLSNLGAFGVEHNQLTGTIPQDLSGLNDLVDFYVDDNKLTGSIPPLSGLPKLAYFFAGNNQLTGAIPAAPSALVSAGLCPNPLSTTPQPAIDPAWDTATGFTPWWATPSASNECDEIFLGVFE